MVGMASTMQAASGNVVWDDSYSALAQSLHKRGLSFSDSAEISMADDAALTKMAAAMGGVPRELVSFMISGK